MKKRVLVTGGAGFIGSHLCEKLLELGYKVLCLDNLLTGRKNNISKYLQNSSFEFINHDIQNPISLEVDEIYNLACPASPVHYQCDPIATMKTSVIGTINVLEIAKKNNAKILQASTSEIYGDPLVHPQKETYWGNVNPIGPRACYDEGKRAAETLCFDYYRQYKIHIKVVRIFNTYGPRMQKNDGRVVSNFIIQALQDKNITIYGSGNQTRSFCYIDDLVNGLIKMMEGNVVGPINLGNPQEITVLELAKKIIMLTGSNSKIVYEPLPPNDPKRRKPNIDKAIRLLCWYPVIDLENGLRRTIEYFQKNKE